MQYSESAALAGTDRIMYEGSMYLIEALIPARQQRDEMQPCLKQHPAHTAVWFVTIGKRNRAGSRR